MDNEKYQPIPHGDEHEQSLMSGEDVEAGRDRLATDEHDPAEAFARQEDMRDDREMRPKVFTDIKERLHDEADVRYELQDDVEEGPGQIVNSHGGKVFLWETHNAQADIDSGNYDNRLLLIQEAIRTLPEGYNLAFGFGSEYTLLSVPDPISDECVARSALTEKGFHLPSSASFNKGQGGGYYFDWSIESNRKE